MKKILRLVTTSVLTLTLVACGEASSSVSTSGTQTSSSVSSTTSAFANVSTITLSAATDVLTQTLGTQKAVVVQAALNANTNPSLALEWFVNGTKSNQTGRVFEYTPAIAGTFKITAKVGSVTSNEIVVTVGAQSLAFTSVAFVDASTIEVKAEGGYQVTVSDNEVLETSYYDLAKEMYVINLEDAVTQGDTLTLTFTKPGNQVVTRTVTFDTRAVEVAVLEKDSQSTGTLANDIAATADGSFELTKPHLVSRSDAATDINLENETEVTYVVSFASKNITGLAVPYTIERVSAPTGAATFNTLSNNVSVAATDTLVPVTISFKLDATSPVGAYVYKLTLGGKSKEVTVNVKAPEAAAKFDQYTINNSSGDPVKFDLKFVQTTASVAGSNTGVAIDDAGEYNITKDYLKGAGYLKTLEFKLDLDNFSVPTELLAQASTRPNQVFVSVLAPNAENFIRVQPGVTQLALPTARTFRANYTVANSNTPDKLTVSQIIDSGTTAGQYTFRISVLQLGTPLLTKDVVINVKDPVAGLTFGVKSTDEDINKVSVNDVATLKAEADGSFVVEKPRETGLDKKTIKISGTLANYQSPLNPTAANTASYNDASTPAAKRDLLTFTKNYVAPMTLLANPNIADTKIGIQLGAPADAVTTTVDAAEDAANTANVTYPELTSKTASVVLADLFVFDVTHLSVTGTYTFSVVIGAVSKSVVVKVIEPTTKLDFTVATGTGEDFSFDKESGKYVANLKAAGGVTAKFSLLLKNFEADSSGLVEYTLARAEPTSSNTTSNTAVTQAQHGNEGNLISNRLVTLITNKTFDADMPNHIEVPKFEDLATTNPAGDLPVIGDVDIGVTDRITLTPEQLDDGVFFGTALSGFVKGTNDSNIAALVTMGYLTQAQVDAAGSTDDMATVEAAEVLAYSTDHSDFATYVDLLQGNSNPFITGSTDYLVDDTTLNNLATDALRFASVDAAFDDYQEALDLFADYDAFMDARYSTSYTVTQHDLYLADYNKYYAAYDAATNVGYKAYLADVSSRVFTAKGEYKYTLTVGGVTETVTLLVKEYPTLKLESAKVGTTVVNKFVDGNFIVEEVANAAITMNIVVEGTNLPSVQLYYKVFDTFGDITAEIAYPENENDPLFTALNADGVYTLDFEDGKSDVSITLTNSGGFSAGGAVTKVTRAIAIYELVDDTLELVGHKDIDVWVADLVA